MRCSGRRRVVSALSTAHLSVAIRCFFVLVMGIGGGCQTTDDIKRTLDYGQAFFPASATKDGREVRNRGTVLSDREFVGEQGSDGYREIAGSWPDAVSSRIKPGVRLPVVVFLHGCSGYGHYTTAVAEFFLSSGVVVVAPNSLNRPGRMSMCGSGNMAYRATLRKAEAQFAAETLAKLSWVDTKKMILAGHSEGGNSVASYSGNEFTAHIITGTSCRHNGGSVSAPEGVSVLAIKGAEDTTYPDGRCAVRRKYRGSKSIVIPDKGHMVVTSKEAKNAILEFLSKCCSVGTNGVQSSQ